MSRVRTSVTRALARSVDARDPPVSLPVSLAVPPLAASALARPVRPTAAGLGALPVSLRPSPGAAARARVFPVPLPLPCAVPCVPPPAARALRSLRVPALPRCRWPWCPARALALSACRVRPGRGHTTTATPPPAPPYSAKKWTPARRVGDIGPCRAAMNSYGQTLGDTRPPPPFAQEGPPSSPGREQPPPPRERPPSGALAQAREASRGSPSGQPSPPPPPPPQPKP